MLTWFGLPTEDDLKRPDDMSESHWGLVFDAHMKRHDAFYWGMLFGFLVAGVLSMVVQLFVK
jgi:hypothetical protein